MCLKNMTIALQTKYVLFKKKEKLPLSMNVLNLD